MLSLTLPTLLSRCRLKFFNTSLSAVRLQLVGRWVQVGLAACDVLPMSTVAALGGPPNVVWVLDATATCLVVTMSSWCNFHLNEIEGVVCHSPKTLGSDSYTGVSYLAMWVLEWRWAGGVGWGRSNYYVLGMSWSHVFGLQCGPEVHYICKVEQSACIY